MNDQELIDHVLRDLETKECCKNNIMEETEVYDGEQKPLREGVYKRNYASMGWPDNKKDNWLYCWWDGEWKIGAGTPQEARQDKTVIWRHLFEISHRKD